MDNYIIDFIGIKDICITNCNRTDTFIELTVETAQKEEVCPYCNNKTKRIHDYRIQRVKDICYNHKHVFLLLKKRRYFCAKCKKSFYEKYSFLPKHHQMTNRVSTAILHELKGNSSMKDIAKRYNVSGVTVARILDLVNFKPQKLPTVLAIDEFKGNAGNYKYHCSLADPIAHKILDITPNREKTHLIDYFKQFKVRNDVEIVIMDMWEPYRDIAKFLFPKAKIVIDKYHYVRQVHWALDNVRKRIQRKFSKDKRIYFKNSKKLFNADYSTLNDEYKQQLHLMLAQNGELQDAWTLKENFRDFQNCHNSIDGRRKLKAWLLNAEEFNIPEFEPAIRAFQNWFEYIINSKDTSYTNGFLEGKHNRFKVIKRVAFGYKNFERFRKRLLLSA